MNIKMKLALALLCVWTLFAATYFYYYSGPPKSTSNELEYIGFPLNIWGPRFWFALHMTSITYPEQPTDIDRNNARAFVEAFMKVIPCMKCREHFAKIVAEDPMNLDSRATFMEWTWRIHNRANKDGGRGEFTREQTNNYFREIAAGMHETRRTTLDYIMAGTAGALLVATGAAAASMLR